MKDKNIKKDVLYNNQITQVYDYWMGNGYYDYEKLASAMAKIAKQDSRILEIGIGTGNAAIPLAKLGFNIDGIDQSPFMLQKLQVKLAEQSLPIKYYEQSVENIQLDTTYDVVFSVGGPYWVAMIDGKPYMHAQLDRKTLLKVFKRLSSLLSAKGRLIINIQKHGNSFTRRLSNGMDYHFTIDTQAKGNIVKTHYFHKGKELVLKQQYSLLQLDEKDAKSILTEAGFTSPITDPKSLFWVLDKG